MLTGKDQYIEVIVICESGFCRKGWSWNCE